MTKLGNIDKMKAYWEKLLIQVQTNTIPSSINKQNQEYFQSMDTNSLAELYFKNSSELFTIFKKLSKFTDTFKFTIRKDFIIINCITQSRILLTYLKLSNFSFKFYKGGELYIGGKQLTNEINQDSLKNFTVKLIFTKNSLKFSSLNQNILIHAKISDDYLNEILVEGFYNLNYTNKVKLHRSQLEKIVLDQEQNSDIFKLGIFNGSISFIRHKNHKYLGFSLRDIKGALKLISRDCKYLELFVDEEKPLKIQVDLKLLGNSTIIFYFSQHI